MRIVKTVCGMCGGDNFGASGKVITGIAVRGPDRQRPQGEPFQECYNVRTAHPLPWYLDMYKKVKDEVAAMGVAFLY